MSAAHAKRVQKGTGKWTGISALDMGIPLTLIAESVFARCVSSLKPERVQAAKGAFTVANFFSCGFHCSC
jgi:6-phosphogluconate dehydrogenase